MTMKNQKKRTRPTLWNPKMSCVNVPLLPGVKMAYANAAVRFETGVCP